MIKVRKFLQRAFLWSRLRTFGELSILTRASFILLFFVPVLAGVWPKVASFVGSEAPLPLSWVLSFFASVAVTLGQLVYQAYAPELIKQFSETDYADSEFKRYQEQKLPGQLESAISTIAFYTGKDRKAIERSLNEYPSMVDPLGVAVDTPEAKRGGKVHQAASLHYRSLDGNFLAARLVSGIMYLIGLMLIVWVLVGQIASVLRAGALIP